MPSARVLRFELRHEFDASVDEVLAAMLDPSLTAFLKAHMQSLKDARPIERVEDEATVRRKVRYVPRPIIARVGPKRIPPEALAFVEESTFDRGARQIRYRNVSEHHKVRRHVDNGGTITFRDLGDGRTERVVQGELRIANLPLVLRPLAAIAEQVIFPSARRLLDEEAHALAAFLKQRGAA